MFFWRRCFFQPAAIWEVPRHLFVPPKLQRMANMDGPLPIGEGQTISQPYLVALMTELGQGGLLVMPVPSAGRIRELVRLWKKEQ